MLWYYAFFVTIFLAPAIRSADVADVGSKFEKKWNTENLQNRSVDYKLKLVKDTKKIHFKIKKRIELKLNTNKTSLTLKINPVESNDYGTYTITIENRENVYYRFEFSLNVTSLLEIRPTPTVSGMNNLEFIKEPNKLQNMSTGCELHANVSYSGRASNVSLVYNKKRKELNGENGYINLVITNVTDGLYTVIIENDNYVKRLNLKIIINNATNTDPLVRMVCKQTNLKPTGYFYGSKQPGSRFNGSSKNTAIKIIAPSCFVAATICIGLSIVAIVKLNKKRKSEPNTDNKEQVSSLIKNNDLELGDVHPVNV